jgi:hypothetical protein
MGRGRSFRASGCKPKCSLVKIATRSAVRIEQTSMLPAPSSHESALKRAELPVRRSLILLPQHLQCSTDDFAAFLSSDTLKTEKN